MTEQLGPDPLEDTRLPELASIERLCNAACDLERAIAAKAKRILTGVTWAYVVNSPEAKEQDVSIFNAYWCMEVELLPLRPFGGYFNADHFDSLGSYVSFSDYDGPLEDDLTTEFLHHDGADETFALHSHARKLENFVGWTQQELAEIRKHLDRIAIAIDGMLSLTDYSLDPRTHLLVLSDRDDHAEQLLQESLRDFSVALIMASGAGGISVTPEQLVYSCSFELPNERVKELLEPLSTFMLTSVIVGADGEADWAAERLYLSLVDAFRVAPRDWSQLSELDSISVKLDHRSLKGVLSLSRAAGDAARKLIAFCNNAFEWTTDKDDTMRLEDLSLSVTRKAACSNGTGGRPPNPVLNSMDAILRKSLSIGQCDYVDADQIRDCHNQWFSELTPTARHRVPDAATTAGKAAKAMNERAKKRTDERAKERGK